MHGINLCSHFLHLSSSSSCYYYYSFPNQFLHFISQFLHLFSCCYYYYSFPNQFLHFISAQTKRLKTISQVVDYPQKWSSFYNQGFQAPKTGNPLFPIYGFSWGFWLLMGRSLPCILCIPNNFTIICQKKKNVILVVVSTKATESYKYNDENPGTLRPFTLAFFFLMHLYI